jgi:hypothetical protein
MVITFRPRKGLYHLNNQIKEDERHKKQIQDFSQKT